MSSKKRLCVNNKAHSIIKCKIWWEMDREVTKQCQCGAGRMTSGAITPPPTKKGNKAGPVCLGSMVTYKTPHMSGCKYADYCYT